MTFAERIWWSESPGPAAALLPPLVVAEALFRAGAALRRALYDRGVLRAERAAAPVVSIGNLAVGGAGKTPVAIAVAGLLLARGRRVAVLSRGYGASRSDPRVVSDASRVLLGAAEGGDEPALVARRLRGVCVLCGPRRADLARTAVESLGADALVLDDGFQHRSLARDLDVVVLDAARPFGNGHLLPAGPGREPRSALRRAHLVWLSRVDAAQPGAVAALRALASSATGREPVESVHSPVDVLDGALARSFGLDALRGRRVLLLAGIARPGGFRRTLEALGAEVVAERIYADHHRYSPDDVARTLLAAEAARCDLVATTEKDAVRLGDSTLDPRLRAVRIEARIVRGAEVLERCLDEALAAFTTSTTNTTPTTTTTTTSTTTTTTTTTSTPTTTPTTTSNTTSNTTAAPKGAR